MKCCFADEWYNFCERKLGLRKEIQLLKDKSDSQQEYSDKEKEWVDSIRQWTSYRGQTLARTGAIMFLFFTIPSPPPLLTAPPLSLMIYDIVSLKRWGYLVYYETLTLIFSCLLKTK